MWSGGDPAGLGPGYVRKARNIVWADKWVSRPQFTYDNLTNVRGLGLWYDTTNRAVRMVATTTAQTTHIKAASGETLGSDVSGGNTPARHIIDSISYRGRFISSMSDALGTYTPASIQSYDGTTYNNQPLVMPFYGAHALGVYKERVIYGGVRLTGLNFVRGGLTLVAYDPSTWTATTVTTAAITANGTTLYRITPTSTTGSQILTKSGAATFGIDATTTRAQFLCQLRGVSPDYDMPITAQIKYATARANTTAYTVGQVVVPATPNDYRYRCTVAGTSAGAPPVYPTTVGTTVADGTVTWICEGSDVAAQREATIPRASGTQWTSVYVLANIPDGAKTEIACCIKFGTTATPTITLASLDFAYKDARALGDLQKDNHGQQLVSYAGGDFTYPFFQNEAFVSDVISLPDYLYWSDPLEPLKVRASYYYRLTEVPGPITAVRAAGQALAVFKRNARWIFGATEDPNTPILPQGDALRGAGCLNPKALDIADHDGALYYVGEDGVYRWRIGDEPEELCGEAMLREMFNKSTASWVESQSAPANRALLTIDQKNKRVLVYVQKGKIHCYDIRRSSWSVLDAGGGTSVNPVGYQICDMLYNPNTGCVYFAFSEAATGTAGLARLDETQSPAEDQISSTGTLPVRKEVWLRPMELSEREDLALDNLRVHHAITASQSGQTLQCDYSFDHGLTFSTLETMTISPISGGEYDPIDIPYYQSWGTIMPRLLHSGKGGATSFNFSRIEAEVDVLSGGGEYPKETA